MTTEQQSLVGGSEIEKLRKEGITDKGIMGKLSTGRLELQRGHGIRRLHKFEG
jgi:hypothetical protein